MKFKVPKEILLSAIQKVQNIVSSKATLPILSNMLIDVRKSKLRLNATDLDIGISCEIPVETIEEGAITIPAKRFSDIIREMPGGDILIHAKKTIRSILRGMDAVLKLTGYQMRNFQNSLNLKIKKLFVLGRGY